MSSSLSLVYGPRYPPLWNKTLANLIHEQVSKHADREAVVVPWQSTRLTYGSLDQRSALLAKALLGGGFKRGDCVGIMAGNCEKYVAVFFAAARVGAILVVLNNTYTAKEAIHALRHTSKLS